MPALYIMIPAALLIVAICIFIFFWAVDSGQYDDLDSPAHSILFDDQDPQHTAAVEEAKNLHPESASDTDKKPRPCLSWPRCWYRPLSWACSGADTAWACAAV